jgi:D-beta-D-heptose 7-phosphate kinase / D-beta-D-heptose 1-phosphate adenosyltransferase
MQMQKNIFGGTGKLLVVGDIMLDRYFEGETFRVSPEAPVPILKVTNQFARPGGAANVALNIAALGFKVTLLGFVGNDDHAEVLRSALIERGVACEFQIGHHSGTIVKLRALSMRQQMLRMDFEDSFANEDHGAFTNRFREILPLHDVVVFSDYAKGTLTNVAAMISFAKSTGKQSLVDPKGLDFERYRGADVLTPNLSEFRAVVGDVPDESILADKAMKLLARHSLESIIVTRGEKGMTLIEPDGSSFSIPAEAQEVFDVTGAGDTVIATLAVALASQMGKKEAMQVANSAAAIAVSRKGTTAVSRSDLEAHLFRYGSRPIYQSDTIAQIADVKRRGETIVMTNGCFDILHAGHIDYLQRAKDLGDRLVVAVNSDASVRRLKGPERPINSLQNRLAMLAALKCVDWVISFDGSVSSSGNLDDTPLDVIQQIGPDILVKGGDYTKSNIVGAQEVEQNGGRVEILPFVDGLSTTAIVNRLKLVS